MTYFRKWLIFYYIDLLIDMHSLVYTSDRSISNENKARVILWDLRRQNNKDFSLFRLLFCFWLMLGLWSYAYAFAYDDPYLAGLTSFLCFAFCLALILMLMLSCEPGLSQEQKKRRNKEKFSAFVLYLQVPEDKSSFVFLSILCLCLCRQCGYPDIFSKDSLPKDILPKDVLPNAHFADGHFAEWTI